MVSQPPDEDINSRSAHTGRENTCPIQETTVLYVDQLLVFSYRVRFADLSNGQRDGRQDTRASI